MPTARSLVVLVALHGASVHASSTPISYDVTLALDLAQRRFDGAARVEVELSEPSAHVVLHAEALTLVEASATSRGRPVPVRPMVDSRHQRVDLVFGEALQGRVTVVLAWRGVMSADLHGLYTVDVDGQRYALTQLEPTYARRVFPCFDEPGKKARFRLTVSVPRELEAVSNAPIVRERTRGATRVVEFAETRPLAPYLVALAVGRFTTMSETIGGVPVRVLARPGRGGLRDAMTCVRELLPRIEGYLGTPYPFAKLDLVAVPALSPGAMENAGLLFFRESRLLVAADDPIARRLLAQRIAHELAHQWLGDLLTPRWWDDLWLAEAGATFVAEHVLMELAPDGEPWADFERRKDDMLAQDSSASTRAVRAPIDDDSHAAERFDDITYVKGASILRMMESWLGAEVFARGVRRFVARNVDGSVTGGDLWGALELESGQPVSTFAGRWMDAPGHPLINVESTCRDDMRTITLQQARDGGGAGVWPVPITLGWSDGELTLLFSRPHLRLRVRDGQCRGNVTVTNRATGVFRLRSVSGDASTTPPVDGVAVLGDAWAAVHRHELSVARFLALAHSALVNPTPALVAALRPRLARIGKHVRGDDHAVLLQLIDESLRRTALIAGESEELRRLRTEVLQTLGAVARARRAG